METIKSSSKPLLGWQSSSLKWLLVTVLALFSGYLIVLMYAQGESLFALLTLVLLGSGLVVFSCRKTYAWRYVYPGLAGMGLFVLFPLICTIAIAFTNYSSTNQLTFERAQTVLMQRQFAAGNSLNFQLYSEGSLWRLQLTDPDQGKLFISELIQLDKEKEQRIKMRLLDSKIEEVAAPFRTITQHRQAIGKLVAILPEGNELRMSSLREFSGVTPLYSTTKEKNELHNNQTGVNYRPNDKVGFYQAVTADGQWTNETISPGYTVSIGWANFVRVLLDEGIRQPFMSIFIWTIVFSALTVFFTVAIGMVLGCLMQWQALKGKALYRVLLILPYAVPAFISILIFKGLFNQSFGEINMMLTAVFGLKPAWFSDPLLAKSMIIIVNTWLGYPYMMILCMGLLKAIPDDLYEASAMDGAGAIQNFFYITFPLLFKPLIPLMIASFAFNFNNFVLIQLLTNGGPTMLNTSTPAGHTDLLVSYTYRIAFEGGGGQDFGLAAAIATLIFLLVGGLALLNLKVSKMNFD